MDTSKAGACQCWYESSSAPLVSECDLILYYFVIPCIFQQGYSFDMMKTKVAVKAIKMESLLELEEECFVDCHGPRVRPSLH